MKKGVLFLYTWLIIKLKQVSMRAGLFKSDTYSRFALVCMPRSGSVLLHTYLNSHINVFSHGEILRSSYEMNGSVPDIGKVLFGSQSRLIRSVGLKLFYHFHNDSIYGDAFKAIADDQSIKIIHLIRSDTLRQFVSLKIGEATGVMSSTKESSHFNKPKIRIDKDDYEHYVRKKGLLQKEMIDTFKDHEVLTVYYEDLVSNKTETLLTVQKFIGIRPRNLFSLLKKQNPEPIEQLVENWRDFN